MFAASIVDLPIQYYRVAYHEKDQIYTIIIVVLYGKIDPMWTRSTVTIQILTQISERSESYILTILRVKYKNIVPLHCTMFGEVERENIFTH